MNKLCAVCGEPINGEYVVGRVHEGRLPNTHNRWRTIGAVHEKCEPLLEDVIRKFKEATKTKIG